MIRPDSTAARNRPVPTSVNGSYPERFRLWVFSVRRLRGDTRATSSMRSSRTCGRISSVSRYSTLAPSRYTVYLHPTEFARLETIIPVLQEQTIRALDEELRRLNAAGSSARWMRVERAPEIRNAAADWHIAFMADPDEELKEGDLLVDSELLMPARPDLGLGEQTRQIATLQSGQRATTIEHTINRPASPSTPRRLGHIEYQRRVWSSLLRRDQGLLHHRARWRRVSGGRPHRLVCRRVRRARSHPPGLGERSVLPDRSEHARNDVERPPRTEGFRRGRRNERENRSETPLPDVAKMRLADTVFLKFRKP